jgi:competence ComEA-like helix-hairpin-helix protein
MSKLPAFTSNEKPNEIDQASLWLRRGDQLFVGVLVLTAIVLLAISWIQLGGWGTSLVNVERLSKRQYDYQLDINRANWIEWTLLEGIGEKMAKRIVAYRDEHGPFVTVDALSDVPGIGPKTLERMRPWLVATPPDSVP